MLFLMVIGRISQKNSALAIFSPFKSQYYSPKYDNLPSGGLHLQSPILLACLPLLSSQGPQKVQILQCCLTKQ